MCHKPQLEKLCSRMLTEVIAGRWGYRQNLFFEKGGVLFVSPCYLYNTKANENFKMIGLHLKTK